MARRKPVGIALDDAAADLVSAALRHVSDAEHLADPNGSHPSPDQAHHLAGYAPECMRKATLGVRWFDMAIGHRFDAAAERVIDFAIAMEPMALRYNPPARASRFPVVAQWREDVRYQRTGSIDPATAQQCVAEAREMVDEMLFALWADGRLKDEVLP